MNEQRSGLRIGILSGLATVFGVVGPLIFLMLLTIVLETILGQSADDSPEWAVFIFIAVGLLCGGIWGGAIARLAGTGRESRMRVVGALIIIPAVLLDVWLLTTLDEHLILRKLGFDGIPQYQQFTIIFVLSVFIVAALSSLALSLVTIRFRTAIRIGALTGLGAALTFLSVNVAMDFIGYRVGAPRPGLWPDLPSMPTVTIIGSIAGALIGGGLMGWLISEETKKRLDAPAELDLEPRPEASMTT